MNPQQHQQEATTAAQLSFDNFEDEVGFGDFSASNTGIGLVLGIELSPQILSVRPIQ